MFQAKSLLTPSYPAKHSLYNMLGEALSKSGDLDGAERHFQMALDEKSDHVPAHLTFGHHRLKQVRLPINSLLAMRQHFFIVHTGSSARGEALVRSCSSVGARGLPRLAPSGAVLPADPATNQSASSFSDFFPIGREEFRLRLLHRHSPPRAGQIPGRSRNFLRNRSESSSEFCRRSA